MTDKFWDDLGFGVGLGPPLGLFAFAIFCGVAVFYVVNAELIAYESCVKHHSVQQCMVLREKLCLPPDVPEAAE